MIKPEKCTNCRSCEIICSFNREQAFNPRQSAVTVIAYEEAAVSVPIMCLQCEDPTCMKVCPVGAISREESGTSGVAGNIHMDEKKCIVCKMCLNACTLGNITFSPEKRKVFKCELCGGDPLCAKACPSGAIIFEDPTYGAGRKQAIANSFKEVFGTEAL